MAGDTLRDLEAGANAGAALVVGVLTGAQDAATLARPGRRRTSSPARPTSPTCWQGLRSGMDLDDVRELVALALPGRRSESPHFDLTSFRVGTKIFATAPLGR